MDKRGHSDPLGDLERRWKEDRSSQLTLQLAEDYRRKGELDRAIEVLREGLAYHPTHMSARVALGRYLLEGGSASDAKAALESVVDDDPTHLVANKLLVSAELETGARERAQRRLDLYESLNPGDPELESLRERVAAAAGEKDRAVVTGEAAGAAATEATPEPTAIEGPDKEQPQVAVLEPKLAARTEGGDPFGRLSMAFDRQAYSAAIAREGIFQISAPRPAPAFEAPEPTTEAAPEATEEAPEGVAEEAPEEATVTLGRLYLEQGHSIEAERIFRAVLEADPGNKEAAAGLSEALGEGQGLRAADLVDPATLAAAEPVARKRLVLEGYRERLRAAGSRS